MCSRPRAVLAEILAVDDRHRNQRAVARRRHQPLGRILRRVIAARDFAHLQRFEPAIGEVIVVDRARRDHRLVADAAAGRRWYSGLPRKPGDIARLRETRCSVPRRSS